MVYLIVLAKKLSDDDARNYDNVGELSNETDCDSGSTFYRYSDISDYETDHMSCVPCGQCGIVQPIVLADYRTFQIYITYPCS